MKIQMVDLVGQYRGMKAEIDAAVLRVLESGQYILGREVSEFEAEVSRYLGVKHAVACASGTDALQIALMALDIRPGDEVVTTPFTFVATTEVIVLLGAKPVYVDIDPRTFNIDVTKVRDAVTRKTKLILPVHLYGQSCDMDPLMEISREMGIPLLEDACQSIGGEYKSRKLGGLGLMAAFSFFPSKNLGAFGDGGMVTTNDAAIAERLRLIASHGSRERYKHEVLGVNSRLDAIQAAILRVKMKRLEGWIDRRRSAAQVYDKLLANARVEVPFRAGYAKHVFHQYTIRVKNRDAVCAHLAGLGIPYGIYYPIPLHRQEAFRSVGGGSFPASESAAGEVLSLPMHTELTKEEQSYVVQSLLEGMNG